MENVGYVLITCGLCNASFSLVILWLIQYVDRIYIFLFATIVNTIAIATLFTWHPNPDETYMLHVLAALWGAGDAVWQAQINGN